MSYDKVILVLGASGTVGSGVVANFLKEGKTLVVAPIKKTSEELTKTLKDITFSSELLLLPELTYYDGNGPQELAAWITANIPGGQIDHVFSVAGGLARLGPVTSFGDEEFLSTVDTKVLSQLKFAKYLMPLVKDKSTSSYTIVTGLLGEVCLSPEYGMTSVANAATFGLVLALQSETSAKALRVLEYRICVVVESAYITVPYPTVPKEKVAKLYETKIVLSDAKNVVVRANSGDF